MDLDRLLNKCRWLLASYPKSVPVTMRRDAGTCAREIYTDGEFLWEVLVNFLTNACKYTQRGLVELTISAVDDGPSSMLQVECVDTGIGVSPDQAPQLFRPFSTLQRRCLSGTGIGLYNVAQKCRALKGCCGHRNNDSEEGSVFWAKVPYCPTHPPADDGGGKDGEAQQRLEEEEIGNRIEVRPEDSAGSGAFFSKELPHPRCLKEEVGECAIDLVGPNSSRAKARGSAMGNQAVKRTDAEHLQCPKEGGGKILCINECCPTTPTDGPSRCEPLPLSCRERYLGQTVLIVDDTATILRLLKHALQRRGFHVDTATNGADALRQMQAKEYSLVLLDVQMPVSEFFLTVFVLLTRFHAHAPSVPTLFHPSVDGIECTDRLRRWERDRGRSSGDKRVSDRRQLICGLSANSEEEDLKLYEAAGMDDFIAKPLRAGEMDKLLRKHLAPGENIHHDARGWGDTERKRLKVSMT